MGQTLASVPLSLPAAPHPLSPRQPGQPTLSFRRRHPSLSLHLPFMTALSLSSASGTSGDVAAVVFLRLLSSRRRVRPPQIPAAWGCGACRGPQVRRRAGRCPNPSSSLISPLYQRLLRSQRKPNPPPAAQASSHRRQPNSCRRRTEQVSAQVFIPSFPLLS